MKTFTGRRLLATLCLIALTGCTDVATLPVVDSAPAGGDRAEPQASTLPEDGPSDAAREVVRTGSLTVRTADAQAAATQLRALAGANGGYVSSENLSTGDGTRARATIVLSVPADSLDRVMDEAARVGELVTRELTAKDVTATVADVDARVRTLRESIERVRALMNKAGSIADVARVESELTSRQSELESMLASQKALQKQVERAPITVTLVRPADQVVPTNPFVTGLTNGWAALQNSIAVLLTVLGAVLPFALIAGAIGWPLIHRRRKAGTTAAQAKSAEEKPEDLAG